MHNLAANPEQTLTLVLRSEEGRNLYYIVELEDGDEVTLFYRGENYCQASLVAERVYSWLIENTQQIFNLSIEDEYARGITYTNSLDGFPGSADRSRDFYYSLCDEFSALKVNHIQDINGLFRKLVDKYKLNEYQEHKFLSTLKELGHV